MCARAIVERRYASRSSWRIKVGITFSLPCSMYGHRLPPEDRKMAEPVIRRTIGSQRYKKQGRHKGLANIAQGPCSFSHLQHTNETKGPKECRPHSLERFVETRYYSREAREGHELREEPKQRTREEE